MWKAADGSGHDGTLHAAPMAQVPRAALPDGRLLAYTQDGADSPINLWLLPLQEGGSPRAFAHALGAQWFPAFSPDSRWIVYASTESGASEVYVRPADGSDAKWQVSVGGGREPLWSRSGDRIFYRLDSQMLAVDVDTRSGLTFGKARVLFDGPYTYSNIGSQNYDLTPDDRRFVMIRPASEAAAPPLNIVTNWFEEVKRLTPAGK
jgi:hypothetical protein